MLETGDESKGEYQQAALPAQDVTEGRNVYSVDFNGKIKSAYGISETARNPTPARRIPLPSFTAPTRAARSALTQGVFISEHIHIKVTSKIMVGGEIPQVY